MNNRFLPTIKYAWLQGSFWMSFCIVFAYASMFLLSRGFSNSAIGLIIAVAGVISVLLQPVVAGLADRSRRFSLRFLLMFLSVCMLLGAAVLLVPGLYFWCNALFYGILLAILQIMTPLVNAIGMECINRGIPVNFGLARGIGSLSYALISFLAGMIIAEFSTTAIPVLILLCYLFVFLAARCFLFRSAEEEKEANAIHTKKQDKEGQNFSFFKVYRKFFVLLTGISLLFICHNILSNYLFQIMSYYGGGSREMGIAAGIAATLELPTMAAFSFLIRKMSSGTLLKISAIFFTIKSCMTLFAAGVSGIYLAQTAQMFGFALFIPASVYYTNMLMRPCDRAKGQALMTATNTIGSVFGSLIGGFLLDGIGVPAMLALCAVVSALGMILVFLTVTGSDKETSPL